MHACERCKTVFHFQSRLLRHQERKVPCKVVEIEENKDTTESESLVCQWCNKELSFPQHRKRHEMKCRYYKDPVRHLEIKLGINLDEYYTNKCRFCDKCMKAQNLIKHHKICKEKDKYLAVLIERNKHAQCCQVVNVTNNDNRIINNNIVVVNAIEDTERTMRKYPKTILNLLQLDNQASNDTIKWETGKEMVIRTHLPEKNNNLQVKNERSNVIYCFDGTNMLPNPTDKVLLEELDKCREDLLVIKNRHMRIIGECHGNDLLNKLIDTVGTKEYMSHHKKGLVTALYCRSLHAD